MFNFSVAVSDQGSRSLKATRFAIDGYESTCEPPKCAKRSITYLLRVEMRRVYLSSLAIIKASPYISSPNPSDRQLLSDTWSICRDLRIMMDNTVYEPVVENDHALMTVKLDMLQPWPQIDFTSLSLAQGHNLQIQDCSRTALTSPTQNHGFLQSVPLQTKTWYCPSQGHIHDQDIRTCTTWTPRTMGMSHVEHLSSYDVGVRALDRSGVYQSNETTHYGATIRKPNHYSSPVVWTPLPYETCCSNPTERSLATNLGVFSPL